MKKIILFSATHMAALLAGFAMGIYLLPILVAPEAPDTAAVLAATRDARFIGEFRRDLADSDVLHWGEGAVRIGRDAIALDGRLAPGPDYRLYLSPQFVETEADFNRLKDSMVQVGAIRTFDNFIVSVPPSVEPAAYSAVIIWCETFDQFITAASYLPANGGR